MKKRFPLTVLLMILILSCLQTSAFAAKARGIKTDNDSAYHHSHLLQHIGEYECHATGNYIKTRSVSNTKKVIGHLEQADEFQLLALDNGLALICVTDSHQTSPDSWDGMTGWVNADYIDCLCSTAAYHMSGHSSSGNEWGGYRSVLDHFEQAILEQWDDEKIVASGFMEPYFFPDSLDDYGFVLLDINNDRIKELIVMHTDYLNPDEYAYLTAVYTLADGVPVKVVEGRERSRFYLCADGSLYNEGSNGAAYSLYYLFDLVDSALVVREGVLSGDYSENGETCYGWFHVDERADFSYTDHPMISDEEADWRITNYQETVVHSFQHFTTFREYHGQSAADG